MQLDKKKVVFGSVLLCILLFTVAYAVLVWKREETSDKQLPKNPNIPTLEEGDHTYTSRKEAVDKLKEKKPSTVPNLYDDIEMPVDTTSTTTSTENSPDPLKSQRIEEGSGWTMDSWSFKEQSETNDPSVPQDTLGNTDTTIIDKTALDHGKSSVAWQEELLRQEHFFSYTDVNKELQNSQMEDGITVAVLGTQKVAANSRLELYLLKDSYLYGKYYPAFTPVYGFVSFGPNRVFLRITNILGEPLSLTAYDLQDGHEGMYVINNFRAEASREILDDVIQDINIPSVPQVGGLKNLLRRQNRNIKVTIVDHYRLVLKPKSL